MSPILRKPTRKCRGGTVGADMSDKTSTTPDRSRASVRQNHEPPAVIEKRGWRFHHLGIPTDIPRPDEKYLEQFGLYVAGFSTSPYGIEWMRFEKNCTLHPLIQTVAHLAFEVDDLDAALEGQEVIFPPGSPSQGVRAAMILVDGAPIELISFKRPTQTS
jgi:hypothetical protein